MLVRCQDASYVEDDGTFVNVVELLSLGLGIPMGRITYRVRPVADSSGAERSVAAGSAV